MLVSPVFNISPKVYFDTLSMARAYHGTNAGGSLKALAERYQLGEKGTEVLDAKGKKLEDFDEKVEKDGFLVSKNLITKKSKRKCPVCETFSFSTKDDVYMNKFQCCWRCYIQWVEDREERWQSGWRPNNGNDT